MTWTKEEIIDVIHFYEQIEKAYEHGVKAENLLQAYNRLKQIIPSKSEEKTYFREFENNSGYNAYKVVQKAKTVHPSTQIKCNI